MNRKYCKARRHGGTQARRGMRYGPLCVACVLLVLGAIGGLPASAAEGAGKPGAQVGLAFRVAKVVALDIKDGKVMWTQPIPAAPVAWGLAIDGDGRVVASLEDGRVLCFGAPPAVAVAANTRD